MPYRTIPISQSTWQTFCENFPDAAQWLMLELDLPPYKLPSLTPRGETVLFAVPQGESAHEHPGAG